MRRPKTGIGEAMKAFRESRGWTLDEMAQFLEDLFRKEIGECRPISRSLLSQWESEVSSIGQRKMSIIEKAIESNSGKYIVRRFLNELEMDGVSIPKLESVLNKYIRENSRKIPAHS